MLIGNAVSKCAFYVARIASAPPDGGADAIHITANYWHYTSGTWLNQNAHLLTALPINALPINKSRIGCFLQNSTEDNLEVADGE